LTGWSPSTDGPVEALALIRGRVIAGGDFTFAGGRPRRGLAALDATTGSAEGAQPVATAEPCSTPDVIRP